MRLPSFLTSYLKTLAHNYINKNSPDFIIGGREDPYILRWFVVPKNRFFKIYLHQQVRDDDDRALHDHPWFNVSIILENGYEEYVPVSKSKPNGPSYAISRREGSVIARLPAQAHRLALRCIPDGKVEHSLSLFLMGPNVREWGFWCPKGWKPWYEFTDESSSRVGKGCE
jgi:hypothetical protein